jgi:transcription elongation GreA/GreB family factor
VKEGDGALDPLPDLPLSPHPNYVTPRGLVQLQTRLQTRQAELAALKARPDRLDKLPEAAAERDIRYLEARLRSAIPVDPANQPLTAAAFGLSVTVEDAKGQSQTYTITGEDEADPARHRITPQAPLARALLGGGVGDIVVWRKPSGVLELTVVKIECPSA